MNELRNILLLALLIGMPLQRAWGKLQVIATTSDIAALAREVGGSEIEVNAIAKGTQDPHFVEAKPSYMVKISRADLVVANGLALEVGWLPSLLRGARNPKIMPGTKGYLELGPAIDPLNVPTGKVTRAMGDVHPEGNPHFMLDPERLGKAAEILATRLGELDAGNKAKYLERAGGFKKLMTEKTRLWQERLAKSGVKKLVTYHSSLDYFVKRYGLETLVYLEPKPGIPPTTQHILDVINEMKKEKVMLILVDNFYDTKIAERVAKDVPGTKIKSVGIAVESSPELKTFVDVQEQLVSAVTGPAAAEKSK